MLKKAEKNWDNVTPDCINNIFWLLNHAEGAKVELPEGVTTSELKGDIDQNDLLDYADRLTENDLFWTSLPNDLARFREPLRSSIKNAR